MTTRRTFSVRSYQRPARLARQMGCRRFIKLWHRRAGKDRSCAEMASHELMKRAGVGFHIFPSLNQGRRDFWDNRIEDPKGSGNFYNMIDTFPPEIIQHRDDKEMQLIFKSGGIYQIMGADDKEAVERLRGPNPILLIASEYATHHWMKEAYSVLRPVLAENDGVMYFAYTPKGFNHGYDLWRDALNDPFDPKSNPLGWFTQKCTVEETFRDALGEAGGYVMTPEMISHEAKTERPEFIRQEYWCDFNGATAATIYGDLLERLEAENHITDIPFVANLPVGVCFDLGKADAMASWFYQIHGDAIKFIDYWEDVQKDMAYWVTRVYRAKPYMIGRLILPWDGWQSEPYLSSPAVNFRNIRVNERTKSVMESIREVRRQFPQFYFDKNKCAVGLSHLKQYSFEWDPTNRVFKNSPKHDEHSHGADALRTGVEGGFGPLYTTANFSEPLRVITEFDPRIPISYAEGVGRR